MKAKAIVSFAGVKYSAIPGQEIEIAEKEVYDDLLRARYVEPVKEEKEPVKPEAKKPAAKEKGNDNKRSNTKKSS